MTPDGKIVLCEVGVGPLSMAFGALQWQRPDIHVMLFEPLPRYAAELRAAIGDRTNVELHEVAIGDEPGVVEFLDEGTSSSLLGVSSPAHQHHGVSSTAFRHQVNVRRISDFDHGQIDLLRVDTEGSEWFCIKHLVSRPQQIVIEMYDDMATYINPHLYEIERWAEKNHYIKTAIRDSDFIYQKAQ